HRIKRSDDGWFTWLWSDSEPLPEADPSEPKPSQRQILLERLVRIDSWMLRIRKHALKMLEQSNTRRDCGDQDADSRPQMHSSGDADDELHSANLHLPLVNLSDSGDAHTEVEETQSDTVTTMPMSPKGKLALRSLGPIISPRTASLSKGSPRSKGRMAIRLAEQIDHIEIG
ncbi:hypothetical protein CYMTET_39375, partial [Cymbomonas tetramitiformis]